MILASMRPCLCRERDSWRPTSTTYVVSTICDVQARSSKFERPPWGRPPRRTLTSPTPLQPVTQASECSVRTGGGAWWGARRCVSSRPRLAPRPRPAFSRLVLSTPPPSHLILGSRQLRVAVKVHHRSAVGLPGSDSDSDFCLRRTRGAPRHTPSGGSGSGSSLFRGRRVRVAAWRRLRLLLALVLAHARTLIQRQSSN